MAGKIIKSPCSKWVLVKRIDCIICKRHVNQLHHHREISQEMTQSENEALSLEDYQFNNIETFTDKFYGIV